MLTQYCSTAVALVAYFTCERFILTMHHLMFGQMTINIECLSTNFTFEYLITRVNLLKKKRSKVKDSCSFKSFVSHIKSVILPILPFHERLALTDAKISSHKRCIETAKNGYSLNVDLVGCVPHNNSGIKIMVYLFTRVCPNVSPAIIDIRKCFLTKEANICIAIGRHHIEISC